MPSEGVAEDLRVPPVAFADPVGKSSIVGAPVGSQLSGCQQARQPNSQRSAVENGCDFVWHPYWNEEDDKRWRLVNAEDFVYGQVTNSAVLYRSWFKKIEPSMESHRLMEPGDWNRFRRIKYIGPKALRYPEPLSRHYL